MQQIFNKKRRWVNEFIEKEYKKSFSRHISPDERIASDNRKKSDGYFSDWIEIVKCQQQNHLV